VSSWPLAPSGPPKFSCEARSMVYRCHTPSVQG
jgi:hypothetical protein